MALLLGSALGSLIALALVATRRMTLQDPVPLGLFWAVGGVVVVLDGTQAAQIVTGLGLG